MYYLFTTHLSPSVTASFFIFSSNTFSHLTTIGSFIHSYHLLCSGSHNQSLCLFSTHTSSAKASQPFICHNNMGSTKKKQTSKASAATVATTTEDMPPELLAKKEQWERENPGKKYTYRKAKKELPSVPDLLTYGSGEPLTWIELIGYPTILVVLFCASFALFLWVDPITNSKYPKGRFSLGKMKARVNPNMQTQHLNTAGDPVPVDGGERILQKKEKPLDYTKPNPHEEL